MPYILLDEENQRYSYPPTNKDNICNYNLDIDLLIKDGYINIEQNLIDLFNNGNGKIENNNIIDISETDEYKNKKRIEQINKELIEADISYNTFLDTQIQYTNNFYYKPKHINDYVLMVASGLSYEIWDTSELYSEIMTTQEIKNLALFLKQKAEPEFQKRKEKRRLLLQELSELNNEYI